MWMAKLAVLLLLVPLLLAVAPEPITLVYDTGINGPQRYNPDGTQCYGEDNTHRRIWYGNMEAGQVMTADVPTCEVILVYDEQLGWVFGGGGPGNATFGMEAHGENLTLSATSPKGVVYPAHDMGLIDHEQVLDRCFSGISNPNRFNIKDNDIGTFVVTLEAGEDVRNAYLDVDVFTDYPSHQMARCPEEDWNGFFQPTPEVTIANGVLYATTANTSWFSQATLVVQRNGTRLTIGATGTYNEDVCPSSNSSCVPATWAASLDISALRKGTYAVYFHLVRPGWDRIVTKTVEVQIP